MQDVYNMFNFIIRCLFHYNFQYCGKVDSDYWFAATEVRTAGESGAVCGKKTEIFTIFPGHHSFLDKWHTSHRQETE
jgi:hypothetical protein